MLRRTFIPKQWKIFRETFFLVLIILGVKVILNYFGWEFMSTSSLMTSILSGSVFVLGFILSNTLKDYKESERLPIELTTAVESIYNDSLLFQAQYKKFNARKLQLILVDILKLFKKDVIDRTKKSFLKAKELSLEFAELEKLGVPANYIVKLKQDQNIIMRSILRVNYIQRIEPIPSAFILVESIVIGLVIILLFTKMDSLFDELIAIGFLTFLFIYLFKLIRVLEKPYHEEGVTMDDVSLFHLEDQAKRIMKHGS